MARKRPRHSAPRAGTATARARVQKWKLAVELTALEIAAAHDGFLRGKPEPAVLIGAFFVAASGTPLLRPLGRMLVRFSPRGRFPLITSPPSRCVLKARASGADGDRLVLLAIALEEDGGADVARLYARLADGASLSLWPVAASEPSPASLADLATHAVSAPPAATRVNVIDDRDDLRDACKTDRFVGAALVVASPRRCEDSFRVHFVADDKRNDWTAVLAVAMGG